MITNPSFSSIFNKSDRIDKAKRLGTVYNIYRTLIAALFSINFLLLVNYNTDKDYLLLINLVPTIGYFLISIGLLIGYYFYPRKSLAMTGLALDMIVLTMMLYFSGGTDLQVILLFLVTVAASFMLLRSNQAILITLFAIILVIYQQFIKTLKHDVSYILLNNVGLMAVSFIGVAYLSHSIAKRLTQVEELSQRQTAEVNALNAINEKIVQIIEQGVLVVSHRLEILIANDTAIAQLQLPKQPDNYFLPVLSPTLAKALTPIITHAENATIFRLDNYDAHAASDESNDYSGYIDFRLRTSQLGNGHTLVLVEDLQREQSQAQQLKLAALGQLTASIAHEIRNPLAAISQASQLLIEDTKDANSHLTDDDGILYEMIFKQTQRVNQIIEDVLSLSRQQKPERVLIRLKNWLPTFIDEHFANQTVTLTCVSTSSILFDKHQLEQVLINLINNGMRFAAKVNPTPAITIEVTTTNQFVHIDVIDNGTGVLPEYIPSLFDPFFTTDHQGTGLGLYLSLAFCQANYANLQYIPQHPNTCFRIICPIPTLYQPV